MFSGGGFLIQSFSNWPMGDRSYVSRVKFYACLLYTSVNDVWVQFGRCGAGMCYELVAPLSPSSPIASVLSRKINVLNHLAYLVEDLAANAARLRTMEFVQVSVARPAIAYGGRLIQFFVAPSRLMIELIEAPGHQHRYDNPTSSRTP